MPLVPIPLLIMYWFMGQAPGSLADRKVIEDDLRAWGLPDMTHKEFDVAWRSLATRGFVQSGSATRGDPYGATRKGLEAAERAAAWMRAHFPTAP